MPVKKIFAALGVLCALFSGLTTQTQAAEVPAVSAASALLMDGESGRILFSRNANEPRAIASITKLMTALVAAEYFGGDLSRTVTIRPGWTGIEGTSLYLKPGEELTCQTLLYGLLLQSGNDAAVALAEICAGDTETFVDWMNQRAADLGMTGTHFSDPNGLGDENHYSTALDMAKLGRACLKNETVAPILATRSITLEGRSFTNHNKLLWQYPGCTGMKTGYTRQAGRTLVSSAQREGQTLICVTLDDGNDWADHTALLDYGFETWPRKELARAGEVLGTVPVEGSLLRQAPVTVREPLGFPLREGEK
ncbi:MAG: D-alanyl-D-alanine carboxypeptidase, partial [Ruminiclostridium sp.]|nr:D-alanyl-D-alanine carboxypeptidase [Ruminiclostridium sp.]